MFIQLQYKDGPNGKNIGGLYINIEQISAIRYDKRTNEAYIAMNNGIEYISVFDIGEIFEKIYEARELIKRVEDCKNGLNVKPIL